LGEVTHNNKLHTAQHKEASAMQRPNKAKGKFAGWNFDTQSAHSNTRRSPSLLPTWFLYNCLLTATTTATVQRRGWRRSARRRSCERLRGSVQPLWPRLQQEQRSTSRCFRKGPQPPNHHHSNTSTSSSNSGRQQQRQQRQQESAGGCSGRQRRGDARRNGSEWRHRLQRGREQSSLQQTSADGVRQASGSHRRRGAASLSWTTSSNTC